MTDLKKMTMSELLARYNKLAGDLGQDAVTEFKNLAAARTAVETLEKKMERALNPSTVTDGMTPTGTTSNPAVDAGKYNSSGKRGPNQGVGAYAKELIVKGMDNKSALAAVQAKFPNAKTTTGCIAYYRTALSKAGKAVPPTGDELRAKAEALLEQALLADAAHTAAAKAKAEADAAEVAAKAVQEAQGAPATV